MEWGEHMARKGEHMARKGCEHMAPGVGVMHARGWVPSFGSFFFTPGVLPHRALVVHLVEPVTPLVKEEGRGLSPVKTGWSRGVSTWLEMG